MNIDTKPHKYPIKKTKKLITQLKPYWKEVQELYDDFFEKVNDLEIKMQKDKKIGIDDIEFFWVDGDYVGIGNIGRTMRLIQREELE